MKKLFVTLAAAALVMTGCSKNEIETYDVPNPDHIGFTSSTSRASIADLTTLQGDEDGFRVYGTTDDETTAWYTNVDGNNNYVYNGSWSWAGTAALWPTTDASYPMNFYAMYPAAGAPNAEAIDVLTREVTIAAAAADQVDMLAAKAYTATKPASGHLNLTFNHILSKVNFGIIAGHEMEVEVQSVAIDNANSKNTYDYIAQAWGTTTSTLADYVYYSEFDEPFKATGIASEDEVAPLYTETPHSNHLMLMPQSNTSAAPEAWDYTTTTLETQSYIEVIYRIVDTTPGEDYIGYTAGADYLTDYPNYVNDITWGDYEGGLGTDDDTHYNGALYIRVGFPLTLAWEPGKGYTYNICLGTADSTNGYYIEDTYYDNKGVNTGIPIVGPDGEDVEPGDPVTNGIINFIVDVNDWDDTEDATIL